MDAPSTVFPKIEFENVDEFLLEMQQHNKEIKAGVMIVGDAADYGLVWEWGNVRQKKPGPRTVIGTNPDGKMVWLSIQAPFGYIRINEPFMHKIVDEVLATVSFNQPNVQAITKELEKAAKKISKAIAEVVAADAPIGDREYGDPHPGLLRKSIKPVDPNDVILDQETDEYGSLDISEG